jgi:hypothetical protein
MPASSSAPERAKNSRTSSSGPWPSRSETCRASRHQWPGGVSEAGPSARTRRSPCARRSARRCRPAIPGPGAGSSCRGGAAARPAAAPSRPAGRRGRSAPSGGRGTSARARPGGQRLPAVGVGQPQLVAQPVAGGHLVVDRQASYMDACRTCRALATIGGPVRVWRTASRADWFQARATLSLIPSSSAGLLPWRRRAICVTAALCPVGDAPTVL